MTDEQFKLPDLVLPESTKEGEAELEEERELLKPLLKPAIKPRAYSCAHFNKEKIKIGAAGGRIGVNARRDGKQGKKRGCDTKKSGAV